MMPVRIMLADNAATREAIFKSKKPKKGRKIAKKASRTSKKAKSC